ncbi:MAG: hypothetical protein BWZ10_01695 [candidate division BRC1 bacterium ADurb.BinA364]|nr:MAG: hypothetical protein BWZ10_01695 [candidate division BRC1 bacterium ADurb.BinA364]
MRHRPSGARRRGEGPCRFAGRQRHVCPHAGTRHRQSAGYRRALRSRTGGRKVRRRMHDRKLPPDRDAPGHARRPRLAPWPAGRRRLDRRALQQSDCARICRYGSGAASRFEHPARSAYLPQPLLPVQNGAARARQPDLYDAMLFRQLRRNRRRYSGRQRRAPAVLFPALGQRLRPQRRRPGRAGRVHPRGWRGKSRAQPHGHRLQLCEQPERDQIRARRPAGRDRAAKRRKRGLRRFAIP